MYYTALCVSGLYYSVLNEECRDCPENSEGMESGLAECPCVEGYFRASGEEDLPCTRKFITLIHAPRKLVSSPDWPWNFGLSWAT